MPGSVAENVCHDNHLLKLEAELRKAFLSASARVSKLHLSNAAWASEKLQKSQRAWEGYRNENCALGAALAGTSSSWESLNILMCRENETELRIKYLKELGVEAK